MKRYLALLCCLVFATPVGAVNVWDAAAFEASPGATDNINEGDDRIRELKNDIRLRTQVESRFGSDNSDDNGLHRMGAARCFVDDDAPTALSESITDLDNAGGGGASNLTAEPSNRSTSVDGANEVLGDGRCWIDSDGPDTGTSGVVDGDFDDNVSNVWDTTANAFVMSKGQHFSTVPPASGNLVYNGGFDMWNVAAQAAGGNTGWALELTPTTLVVEALVEGEDQGDGQGINIIDTGAAVSGISQTFDGLKGNTTYMARVSVRDDVGTCRIVSTGAGTQISVDSDDSGNWQTLAGTFITDATPTDVVLKLLAVAQSDDCVFDHAGVYEVGNETIGPNWPPGITGTIVDQDTDTTADANIDNSSFTIHPQIAAQSVIPSRPGQVILVMAKACWESDNATGTNVDFRIRQTSPSATTVDSVGELGFDAADRGCSVMFYFVPIPTVGDTYTFELQGLAALANRDWNNAETSATSSLAVMLLRH